MCGIHGFLWQDQKQIDTMIEIAHHRGPDGSGSWSDANITLGHNLLSIVDEVAPSAQPWIHNNLVIVYNGEIYNYKDLRQTLNYEFKTNTDTEVLAVGLEQQGTDFLYNIDGMFALACYNTQTKELLLARDSNGAKPLYFGSLNNKLCFSSEIKSLLSLGFERKVSKEGFKHFYYAGLTTGNITLFEGIFRLVPGEIVSYDTQTGNKIRSENINNRPLTPYEGNTNDLPELLRVNLTKACDLTLMGRRQVGLFLSGGMDSSSVLYCLAARLHKPPKTFSTRFDAPVHSRLNEDADIALRLSQQFNTEHAECFFTEQDWVNNIVKTTLALEEPRQGRSFPAYYLTNKLLKDSGITVTLSGDGGDELLVGYKQYLTPPFTNKIIKLRSTLKQFKNPELHIDIGGQINYLNSWLPQGGLTGDELNDYMYTECLNHLSEDFLIRNDKLGMAFSMEARFPMLCNQFKNFVRSIPSKSKVNLDLFNKNWSQHNKGLLKQSFKNKLPEYVLSKTKSGWRAPTDDWIIGIKDLPAPDQGPIKEYVRSILTPEILDIFEIPREEVETKFLNNKDHDSDFKPGKAGIGLLSQKHLFIMIMFAVWYKEFNMSM
jgi:asparagine synthase (glutamine-hydrolysing)